MTIATVRRLAADIFHVGENKVRISPDGLKEAEGALTRSDVKGLIDKGIVKKLPNQGRASTAKTTRRGHGHRRGSSTQDSKKTWMMKIRAQRKFLASLVAANAVKKTDKRILYGKLKSGIFRNKRAFLLFLKDNKFVAKEFEPTKAVFVPKPTKPQNSTKTATQTTPSATTTKTSLPSTPVITKPVEKKGEKQ